LDKQNDDNIDEETVLSKIWEEEMQLASEIKDGLSTSRLALVNYDW